MTGDYYRAIFHMLFNVLLLSFAVLSAVIPFRGWPSSRRLLLVGLVVLCATQAIVIFNLS